ncbi:MAG TPA: amidohydrolase, partial [Desulfobulbaceae bacterium]|nr:amidohydrolase [Desulfobulbaceae bacterium]
DPLTIMAMATIGGARTLGIEAGSGTLETGKTASLLAVSIPGFMTEQQDVAEYLVQSGCEGRIAWVNNGSGEQ